MNNLLRFRAWDGKKICRVLGIKFTAQNGVFAELEGHNGDFTALKFNKIMQSTGLPDTNGKEIWEGDILKTTIMKGMSPVIGVMEWNPLKAQFGVIAYVDQELPRNVEVNVSKKNDNLPEIIGNIWENPELINEPK